MNAKNKILIMSSIIILIGFFLYLSSSLYQIFALALIVAYFTHPLKKRIMKKVNNESLASLSAMIIGFSVMVGVIIVFVTTMYSGLVGIASFARDASNVELINNTINLFESYNINKPLTEAGLNQIGNLLKNLIFLTPQIALSIIVFLFMLYYFIKYGEEIISIIKGLVPPAEIKYFDKFLKRTNQMMKAIFQGQFITALVQSIILFLFMMLLNTPYAFELSFFTFILCFFNITVSIVPIGMNFYYFYKGYITGDYSIFLITLVFTIFITSIDNVIKPLIGEKRAQFNPVFFVLGLMGGALTLGFTGFIIGPLLFGMFQAALEILYENKKLNFV